METRDLPPCGTSAWLPHSLERLLARWHTWCRDCIVRGRFPAALPNGTNGSLWRSPDVHRSHGRSREPSRTVPLGVPVGCHAIPVHGSLVIPGRPQALGIEGAKTVLGVRVSMLSIGLTRIKNGCGCSRRVLCEANCQRCRFFWRLSLSLCNTDGQRHPDQTQSHICQNSRDEVFIHSRATLLRFMSSCPAGISQSRRQPRATETAGSWEGSASPSTLFPFYRPPDIAYGVDMPVMSSPARPYCLPESFPAVCIPKN